MRVPSPGRRRRPVAFAAAATCAVAVLIHVCADAPAERPAAAVVRAASGLDDAGYLAVADGLQRRLDRLWNERLGRYQPGPGATVTAVNAELLLVHSVAALHGHDGPARNDSRARAIARFLVGPQVWSERPRPGADPQVTGPGWAAAPDLPNRHPVHDTTAVDGLVHAYLARDEIGLDPGTVDRIRYEIHRVATSSDYRWPALRLNQFNWYTAIFAADATVNGAHAALTTGMGRHLERFAADATSTTRAAGNFGPGLRFHYLPHFGSRAKMNLDSPEYANIVLGFSRHYGQAREAGMQPPARLGLLREWVRRAVAGYWTHSGYLNWDTGLGFERWHQRKKVPLAQIALIGIASQPELLPGPQWGAWAKYLLDRGLVAYGALVEREGGIPRALAYGVTTVPETRGCAFLAAARTAANAMRALEAGLGRRPAQRPPALYSYDPDTGRLAITTPSYNTAIVAVNQRAFPYGGLDIARLYDDRQQVAANIGGVGNAAFGLRVSRAGRTLLRTQYGRRAYTGRASPLRLTRAPRGTGATASSGIRRAYAAPFTDLRARASAAAPGVRASVAYRFTPGWIEARWTQTSRAPVDAVVTFPSWGRRARILATLRDGRTVALGTDTLPLVHIRSFHVMSERSGYRVTPLSAPTGGSARAVAVRGQPSQPNPGPTVTITLPHGRRGTLAARIEVDP